MNPRRPVDLQALLTELSRAGADASGSLVPALLKHFHGVAHARLGPNDLLRRRFDSEDLAQEALVDLVRNVHRFEGESWPEFFAFAEAVMQRRKVDLARYHRARKRGRDPRPDEESEEQVSDPDPGPRTRVVEAETIERARDLVTRLPEAMRIPLQLRLDGHEFAEIARSLGLTEETARKRVSRAIAELRKRWGAPE